MIVAPAYAWMPSDTDTAIGLLGALADGLSAASQAQAQAQQNAAKQTAAARIVNKFSQVSRAMRSHGIKPAYWCNDNWCDSAYVINAGSRGLLITYSALSRANGSMSYVVCYRANANSVLLLQCNNSSFGPYTMAARDETNIRNMFANANPGKFLP
jgi:hypothetical protein